MSSLADSASARERRALRLIPREHGFWVMLSAAVLTALIDAELSLRLVLSAVLVFVAFTLAGGLLGKSIRRHGSLQLASSVLLSFAGVPTDWLAGKSVSEILLRTLCWAGVFLACALVVRAVFASARRNGQRAALALATSAVGLPLVLSAVFATFQYWAGAWALVMTSLGCALLLARRPTVKQLKQVGILLALLTLLAAIALLAI